ncbi:DedA family protein [Acetanaerobacterium elongatum]
MNQFGYPGVAFLIALENIFPPIPSEIILTFGGFMTTYSRLTSWGVILAATVGSLVGAILLYAIGRIFKPERLESWLSGRVGRILHLKQGDVTKACAWFEKRGKSAVFFGRCVPIIRSLISVPAGMAKMNIPLFLVLTTAGSLVWNTVLVMLGVAAGASWELIIQYTDLYTAITIAVIGGIVVILAALYIYKRFLKKKLSGESKGDESAE